MLRFQEKELTHFLTSPPVKSKSKRLIAPPPPPPDEGEDLETSKFHQPEGMDED
jgi:hypothetical protein